MLDPMPSSSLQGRCILVVEDDFVLAEDIRDELEDLGAEVLGPVARVGAALDLLSAEGQPDAAILDINLAGEMVFPVADRLMSRGVPFVFVTGYSHAALPRAYAQIGCVEKPVNMQMLVTALLK
jgi:CheY-like chemotaxis protein